MRGNSPLADHPIANLRDSFYHKRIIKRPKSFFFNLNYIGLFDMIENIPMFLFYSYIFHIQYISNKLNYCCFIKVVEEVMIWFGSGLRGIDRKGKEKGKEGENHNSLKDLPWICIFFSHPLILFRGGGGIRCACLKLSGFSSVHWGPPTHTHPVFCLDQLPLTSPCSREQSGPHSYFLLVPLRATNFYFLSHISSSLSLTDRSICFGGTEATWKSPS